MKELTFEMGLWCVVDMWSSDKSINKGSEQKLTGYIQGTERSSVWLDDREQELEGQKMVKKLRPNLGFLECQGKESKIYSLSKKEPLKFLN